MDAPPQFRDTTRHENESSEFPDTEEVEGVRLRPGSVPFACLWESQKRHLTGTHGQPQMPTELRRWWSTRRHRPVPKLIVKVGLRTILLEEPVTRLQFWLQSVGVHHGP